MGRSFAGEPRSSLVSSLQVSRAMKEDWDARARPPRAQAVNRGPSCQKCEALPARRGSFCTRARPSHSGRVLAAAQRSSSASRFKRRAILGQTRVRWKDRQASTQAGRARGVRVPRRSGCAARKGGASG